MTTREALNSLDSILAFFAKEYGRPPTPMTAFYYGEAYDYEVRPVISTLSKARVALARFIEESE